MKHCFVMEEIIYSRKLLTCFTSQLKLSNKKGFHRNIKKGLQNPFGQICYIIVH